MVVETLTMDTAPWWLNLFIWMATFWQYILIGFVPAFYMAVVKLFGFPLLQRWQSEVCVMLYPNKVKFRKIDQQWDQYVVDGKGVYWPANTLQPRSYETIPPKLMERLEKNQQMYETLNEKKGRTPRDDRKMKRLLREQLNIEKKKLGINPVNTLHIFYHSVNQEVYDDKRRETKINEILHGNIKLKLVRLKKHGVWIMQNPKAHFHRHYVIITNPDFTEYQLVPVKQRQQFGIGFWHSLGIQFTEVRPVEEKAPEESEGVSGNNSKQQLVLLPPISMGAVVQKIRFSQSYQNFSANKMYNILFERRAPLEKNFWSWITGSLTKDEFLLIAVMIGAVASIALIMFLFHGGGGSPPSTPGTGAKPFL